MAVYQGPTRPGTDVARFRSTGESRPRSGGGGGNSVSGPVRPTTDEAIFRATGKSVASGSAEALRINTQLKTEATRLATEQAKQTAKDQQARQDKIQSGTIGGQLNEAQNNFNKTGKIQQLGSPEFLPSEMGNMAIPNQIGLPSNIKGFPTDRGTRQDIGMSFGTVPIRNPGDIYKVQTGTIKNTPVFETNVINQDWSSRPATTSERSQLNAVIDMRSHEAITGQDAPSKAEIYYKEKKGDVLGWGSGVVSNAVGSYTELNKVISEKITNPIFSKVESKTGLNFSLDRDWEKERQNLINVGVSPNVVKPFEFVAGAGLGLLEEVRYKPLKTAVVYGGSAVGGYAIGGLMSGTTAGATTLFGSTAGSIIGSGLKIGATGTGLYLGGGYIAKKGVEVSNLIDAGQYGKAGAIAGVTGKDIAVSFYGFQKGAKLWDITEGAIKTRGRTELNVEQGIYPHAPAKQHVKLFQENYYKELGGRGAFHTTGKKFWKGGEIVPDIGTSELPGLYASTKVSTPFSRVTGSGSSKKIIPNWKDLLGGSNDPAIAYLRPEGFRYSPASSIGGKKYQWNLPVKEGYADVPGIKTEIEAIFRPGSGKYLFESGKYYTKIEGVSVPIDTFIYGGGSGTPTINIPTTTKVFSPSSYGSYSSPAVLNPSAGFSLYSGGSESYTPPKYSISSSLVSSPAISLSSLTSSKSKPSSSGKSSKYKPSSNMQSYLSSVSSKLSSSSLGSSSGISKGSSSSSSSSSLIGSSSFSGFGLPRIKQKYKVKSKAQKGKQRTQYQPSFTASALNIRAVSVPTITGLSIRPIISSKVIKKRKKSKRKK